MTQYFAFKFGESARAAAAAISRVHTRCERVAADVQRTHAHHAAALEARRSTLIAQLERVRTAKVIYIF